MLLDNAIKDGQSQPSTCVLSLSGEERIKKFTQVLWGHAGSVVLNRNMDIVSQ
jgi:hypothetical protein